MQNPRIFVDARTIHTGMTGVGIYTFNILNNLSEIIPAQNISALVLKNSINENIKLNPQINIIETDISYQKHPHNEIWINTKLINLVKKNNSDIFFGPAFVIPYVKTPFKKFVTVHDMIADKFPYNYPFFFREYIKLVTRLSIKSADGIIAVSNCTKKDCVDIAGADEKKIKVIYEAPNSSFYTTDNIEKKNILSDIPKPFILFIGTLEERKDPITLLRAFEILNSKYNSIYHLVYVGNAPKNSLSLLDIIKKSKLYPEKIHLIPHTQHNTIIDFYNNASILVFPSHYEGFGLPPLEAMACGLPVISSDIEVEKEILSDAALFFKKGIHEDLAENIYKLLSDESLRNLYIAKGIEHSNSFSWKKAAKETYEFFCSI